MLRLIGATALVYIGYRVGHRILMESGEARSGYDGLSSVGWAPVRPRAEDGAFDDPEAAGDLTAAADELLPEDIEEALSGGPSDRPGSGQG